MNKKNQDHSEKYLIFKHNLLKDNCLIWKKHNIFILMLKFLKIKQHFFFTIKRGI